MELTLEIRAEWFARGAHCGQLRTWTEGPYIVPYITHPEEVRHLLYDRFGGEAQIMLAAAWLHDVQEDCEVENDDICQYFGKEVADLVNWLTDVSVPADGNRAFRKAKDRAHSAEAPADAQTIKVADLISNSRSIFAAAEADLPGARQFAKVYAAEKALLLDVLTKADPGLRRIAVDLLEKYHQSQPTPQEPPMCPS